MLLASDRIFVITKILRLRKKSICCVALHCNHEDHEEARRKRIKSISAVLGQAFARLASGAFYCVVCFMTFYEIIKISFL